MWKLTFKYVNIFAKTINNDQNNVINIMLPVKISSSYKLKHFIYSYELTSYFHTFSPLYFEGWNVFSTQEHEVSSNYREKSLDIPLTAYITNIPRPESKN